MWIGGEFEDVDKGYENDVRVYGLVLNILQRRIFLDIGLEV